MTIQDIKRPLASILAPTTAESLSRAQSDLRLGLPVLITHNRSSALLLAVETLSQERLSALRTISTPEMVLTTNRARTILSPKQSADAQEGPVRIQPPALATTDWYRRLADTAFDGTGPLGPLHLIRNGETELQSFALTLVKSAELLPAALVFPVEDATLDTAGITHVAINAARAHLATQPAFAPVAASRLPIEVHDAGKLHVFRDPNGQAEHYAMEVGSPRPGSPVLCRLHSACFTGDVLGSLKCDCGPQLRAALARMGEEGAGILLYLNQEGRGIGLANKMRVYDLQARGFDTVEANHRLGFEDDERDFRVGAEILRTLGYDTVRLLTNNPAKVATLQDQGLTVVERVPLKVGLTAHNRNYLAVKALKSGHVL